MEDLIKVEPKVDPRIIRETLSRIGIADEIKKILYPSCYLFNDGQDYFIAHFKQLFKYTREKSYDNLSSSDINRLHYITSLLVKWGMISLDGNIPEENTDSSDRYVHIIPFSDKKNWAIKHKIRLKGF